MNPRLNFPRPDSFPLQIFVGDWQGDEPALTYTDSTWMPNIGEILVLPELNENDDITFQPFKVRNIEYDFQESVTRVICWKDEDYIFLYTGESSQDDGAIAS